MNIPKLRSIHRQEKRQGVYTSFYYNIKSLTFYFLAKDNLIEDVMDILCSPSEWLSYEFQINPSVGEQDLDTQALQFILSTASLTKVLNRKRWHRTDQLKVVESISYLLQSQTIKVTDLWL